MKKRSRRHPRTQVPDATHKMHIKRPLDRQSGRGARNVPHESLPGVLVRRPLVLLGPREEVLHAYSPLHRRERRARVAVRVRRILEARDAELDAARLRASSRERLDDLDVVPHRKRGAIPLPVRSYLCELVRKRLLLGLADRATRRRAPAQLVESLARPSLKPSLGSGLGRAALRRNRGGEGALRNLQVRPRLEQELVGVRGRRAGGVVGVAKRLLLLRQSRGLRHRRLHLHCRRRGRL
mmetsp:Transcript_42342/g.137403  ORF Transcript_42342/g.137403 Transcript_42342/m.137403 type:complete len:239 (-) Transcript_42342:168-884(-)